MQKQKKQAKKKWITPKLETLKFKQTLGTVPGSGETGFSPTSAVFSG
jgi:hypothetical protein